MLDVAHPGVNEVEPTRAKLSRVGKISDWSKNKSRHAQPAQITPARGWDAMWAESFVNAFTFFVCIRQRSSSSNSTAHSSDKTIRQDQKIVCFPITTRQSWKELLSPLREICLNLQVGRKRYPPSKKAGYVVTSLIALMTFCIIRSSPTKSFVIFWATTNSSICPLKQWRWWTKGRISRKFHENKVNWERWCG